MAQLARVAVLLLLITIPTSAGPDCTDWLWRYWNPFALSAVVYRDSLRTGVVNLRLKKDFDKALKDLQECGCW